MKDGVVILVKAMAQARSKNDLWGDAIAIKIPKIKERELFKKVLEIL